MQRVHKGRNTARRRGAFRLGSLWLSDRSHCDGSDGCAVAKKRPINKVSTQSLNFGHHGPAVIYMGQCGLPIE